MKAKRIVLSWAAFALVYAVGFPLALLYGSPGHNWLAYYRLTRGGERTEGTVTGVEPRNHCRANYAYTVKDTAFTGVEPLCEAKVNDKTPVFYMPGDPAMSTARPPEEKLENELITILLGLLVIPSFLTAILEKRRA